MKYLTLHPDDRRWFRRWLRRHLVCLLSILAFFVLVRMQPNRPAEQRARADLSARPATSEAIAAASRSLDGNGLVEETPFNPMPSPRESHPGPTDDRPAADEPLPQETELVYLPNRPLKPVAPQGWRRTDRGWEHVSTWRPIPRPLAQIVIEQEAREPVWLKTALAKVRGLSPLAYAMLQIAAISAIVGFSRVTPGEKGSGSVVASSRINANRPPNAPQV